MKYSECPPSPTTIPPSYVSYNLDTGKTGFCLLIKLFESFPLHGCHHPRIFLFPILFLVSFFKKELIFSVFLLISYAKLFFLYYPNLAITFLLK